MMNNKWKQRLHLEPPKGWLNDPNGLCRFKNKYHVYFQYAPDDVNGGVKKCWGHYESADLLSWDFTGTVLFPDIPADADGVYSGSAIVIGDELNLFYTGNVKHPGENYDYIYSGREANVIRVTTKDGHTMSPKRVVLRNCDYPDFCSLHVRDPKVWESDGVYYMILGARTLDNTGCALIYRSLDLSVWKYERSIAVLGSGYMWECPDCFQLGESSYMSVSLQGISHGQTEHQNLFSSGYFRDVHALSDYTEWDYGFDFYAPQTFDAQDGRRILIGWMGMCDAYQNPTAELGWQHCLTLPRELSRARDGAILQTPMRELEQLRGSARSFADGTYEKSPLPFELCASVTGPFEIKIDTLSMKYNGDIFSIEFYGKTGCGRDIRRVKVESCTDIRIIADMSSIEIYLSGGRYVMSTRFYPESEDVMIGLSGADAAFYPLKGMEIRINGK